MSDHVTAGRVDPDARIVDAVGIGDQDQVIAFAKAVDHVGTVPKDGPVHRGLELARSWKNG